MDNARSWAKPLLWLHLFFFVIWLCVFHAEDESPDWMGMVFILSLLVIQFTWGFTVGLIVGPSRRRRSLLWWSLMPIFMPIYFIRWLFLIPHWFFWGLLAAFILILACETYCGVLLGVKVHSGETDL